MTTNLLYTNNQYVPKSQNHDHLLLICYTRPISSNKTIEKIVEEITEEQPTECSSTNNIYQNITKKNAITKRKNSDNPTPLRKSKKQRILITRH